tara:strand:+ start:4858 stop:5286 length:429 start_codon:yes stop_codon:yes gene_type:complete
MSFLSLSGAIIGSQSVVREKCFILEPKNLEIGKNSSIGFYSEIYNSEKIIIGDNVDIGSQLYINTSNHKFDNPKLPISKQGTISKTINIGSNIWMGARVTILAGVKIEDKVIIGAGSLVNKDLESGYIYAGVPARKIKKVFE